MQPTFFFGGGDSDWFNSKCHGRQLAPIRCNLGGGGSVWDVVVHATQPRVRETSGQQPPCPGLSGGSGEGGGVARGGERLVIPQRGAGGLGFYPLHILASGQPHAAVEYQDASLVVRFLFHTIPQVLFPSSVQ